MKKEVLTVSFLFIVVKADLGNFFGVATTFKVVYVLDLEVCRVNVGFNADVLALFGKFRHFAMLSLLCYLVKDLLEVLLLLISDVV